jgi:hypothetical protein
VRLQLDGTLRASFICQGRIYTADADRWWCSTSLEETIMKTNTLTHGNIPKVYAELVRLFMPRPLRDEVDYRNALGVLQETGSVVWQRV